MLHLYSGGFETRTNFCFGITTRSEDWAQGIPPGGVCWIVLPANSKVIDAEGQRTAWVMAKHGWLLNVSRLAEVRGSRRSTCTPSSRNRRGSREFHVLHTRPEGVRLSGVA